MENNWIYEKTKNNDARFLLGEKRSKTLICIGINPSTAEPDNLDRTIKSVKSFSYDLGYASWLMINVYPQRATDPNDLHEQSNKKLHQQNLRHIKSILKNGKHDIWAAWGTLINKREYLIECLKDIYELTCKSDIVWYTIGKKSKDGHPHHPLYLKKGLDLKQFDIKEYIRNQKTTA